MIEIYEFEDSTDAIKDAELITDNGYTIGLSKISWIDKPHFYIEGNIIVQYIGSQEDIVKDLEKIMDTSLVEEMYEN